MKNILVIGTGTIGEPLIGLLADFRKELKIGNVFFHKRTPLKDEIAKVNSMTARGANLVVDEDKVEEFLELGHTPDMTYDDALKAADVIIDCTPAGNEAKNRHYLPLIKNKKYEKKIFIAQGSEKGFGIPFAHGINDEIFTENIPQFIQIVSCNTHNICSLIDTIAPDINHLAYGDFTCIRRANDISQAGSFIASPEVGAHHESVFGTHHAKDAYDLFRTLHCICARIYSPARLRLIPNICMQFVLICTLSHILVILMLLIFLRKINLQPLRRKRYLIGCFPSDAIMDIMEEYLITPCCLCLLCI